MRTYRTILSAFLAFIIVFALSACNQVGDADTESTTLPAETGGEVTAAMSAATGTSGERSDLVILSMEEYENRPHGIQPGTVLNYAAPNDVPSQLPWNSPSETWLLSNIYEGLLYMYMNDPKDIRGCIAESWSHSDDYLTWTFNIRDGVKFHDGTVCDAPAIKQSWDIIYKERPALITNYNIESWEATNANELVVRLSAPCGWFEVALCGGYCFLIVSPAALDLYGTDDNRAAVGTGPYVIESYTSRENLVLKANPSYYLGEKMPCIETVNFQIITDQYTLISALLSGSIDGATLCYRGNLGGSEVDCYRKLKADGYSGNLTACFGISNPVWLNAKTVAAFRTLEVREAVCRLIDFSAINEELYDGMGCAQDSLWAKGSSGYVPTDQFYYDPDEGSALLASVGLAASDIKFTVNLAGSDKDQMYIAVQNALLEAGIRMEVEPVNPNAGFTYLLRDGWPISIEYCGYTNTTPYTPWGYILQPDALIKSCWQDIYDPELYQKMLDEYDALLSAATWGDMLTHSLLLTAYVQDDFGAIAGVQPPACIALGKDFKNGVYFTEWHDLQLYYLYKEDGQ